MRKLLTVSLSLVLLVSMSFAGDGKKDGKKTVNGFVSDTMCGAKGKSAKHADCAKKCDEMGHRLALVTGDDKVLAVANPEALKGHEGQHVKASGRMEGEAFHVENVEKVSAAGGDAKKH